MRASERKRGKARCVESEACDQTVTLRYRVSLEGFVNVAQLQRSREAHWASFSPPAVCVRVWWRGVCCVWLQAPLTVHTFTMASVSVCLCPACQGCVTLTGLLILITVTS